MSKRTIRFSFDCKACGEDDLRVIRLKGSEGLGVPFAFVLDLAGKSVDAEAMLDAPATLTLQAGQRKQTYAGCLVWFMERGRVKGMHRYRAFLSPVLTRLERNVTNAVYVKKSVPDVLKDVLSKSRFQSGLDFDFKLKESYDKRQMTCRYQEDELQFLHRLTQRSGIYYFFEPGKKEGESQKLIFADSPDAHEAPDKDATLTFLEASGLEHEVQKNAIHTFSLNARQTVKKVVVDDYNPETPDLVVHGEEEAGKTAGQERFFGGFVSAPVSPNSISAKAKCRKQILACRAKTFTGELDAPLARSGFCIKLEKHPLDSFNADYLVTSVQHEGVQPLGEGQGASAKVSYSAVFTAIPSATPFKPEWTAPVPRIAGVLSAVIAAEGSGKYAEVDEKGRYQVILPFGQNPDETPKSAKIHMLQPYGGGDHGLHLPLHKGTEVLLTFLQGDPDRPIICGAVPNVNTPSMIKGEEKTRHRLQTASGNKLELDDNSGNNYLALSSPTADSTFVLGTLPEDVHKKHMQRVQNNANQVLGSGNGDNQSAFQKWWSKHASAKGSGKGLHMITDGLLGMDAGICNTVTIGDSEKCILGSAVKDVLLTDLSLTCGPSIGSTLGKKYKGTALDLHIVRAEGTKLGFSFANVTGDVKEALGEKGIVAKDYKKAVGEKNKAVSHEGKLINKRKKLTETKEKLHGSIQEIADSKELLGVEIEDLKGDVEKLTNEKNEVSESINRMAAQKNELKNAIARLYEERATLAGDVMRIGSTLTVLAENGDEIFGLEEDI